MRAFADDMVGHYDPSMDLELKYKLISEEIAVVEVIGDITYETLPLFSEFTDELLDAGHFKLIFDLRETDLIASEGLSALLLTFRRAHARKGTVHLVATKKYHLKLFMVTWLTRVFKIYHNVPDAIDSICAASSDTPLDRGEYGWHWFPARIYASAEDAGPVIENALSQLLDTFGMEIVHSFSVERRSWFREFILRMKDSAALPTRDEALTLMQRAVENQILGIPQSRIDVAQSQAIAGLLVALEKTPNAVVQSGSVLLIKVRDVIVVRNLSQLELAHWERNPGLFRDPEKALCELQRAWDPIGKVNDPQDAAST